MNNKRKRFDQIARDIKSIKIQGARNVAKAALNAHSLIPTTFSRRKLLSLRPTEPMLANILTKMPKHSKKEILEHFDFSQEKINKAVLELIKNNDRLFTHCHSTNVIDSLINAKKQKKKFEVYNTETRPLFQGRKTTRRLKKAKIPVTQFIDSAARIAILGTQTKSKEKVDKIFLGADAILKKGVINKVGSGMFARIAYDNKIPVYIIADSWKYSKKNVPIEQRKLNEVWDNAPKKVKIKNPAFEFIPKKFIKAIISEYGILSYDKFLKKVNKKS